VNSNLDEVCDAVGIDEDCNSLTIHSEETGNGDQDGDGYVDSRCFNLRDDGTENRGTDCDDTRPTVSPVGVEACDGLDNNCDGRTDEGVLNTFYFDFDNDNYGRSDMNMMSCTRPDGYALVGGDCDDGETPSPYSSSVNPGGTEVCNGRDDDCDGITDPDCDCVNGATLPCGMDVGACELGTQTCVGGEWGACLGGVGPATEVCGGGDEDCDGLTDEPGASGERVFYRDADLDRYGDPAVRALACPGPGGASPRGYVNDSQDCLDTTDWADEVHPGGDYHALGHCGPWYMIKPTPSIDTWFCAMSSTGSGRLPFSFDHNCNGTAEPMPPGACGGRYCFGGTSGPLTAQTASSCGEQVPWVACEVVGSEGRCVPVSGATQRLPCR